MGKYLDMYLEQRMNSSEGALVSGENFSDKVLTV